MMRKLLLRAFAVLGAVAASAAVAAAVSYYIGLVDIGADTPHSPIVYSLIKEGRDRAIARRAREITPPHDWSSPERARRGAGNYAAMCADCHLTPATRRSEIRRGLYPKPPDLTQATTAELSAEALAARRFWVIKHGIKASGMPAWSKGGMDDAAIWDLTALLAQFPALSDEEYLSLVAASDGHVHSGLSAAEADTVAAPPHVDPPGAKPHGHGRHEH